MYICLHPSWTCISQRSPCPLLGRHSPEQETRAVFDLDSGSILENIFHPVGVEMAHVLLPPRLPPSVIANRWREIAKKKKKSQSSTLRVWHRTWRLPFYSEHCKNMSPWHRVTQNKNTFPSCWRFPRHIILLLFNATSPQLIFLSVGPPPISAPLLCRCISSSSRWTHLPAACVSEPT